jgi:hypothetical protein
LISPATEQTPHRRVRTGDLGMENLVHFLKGRLWHIGNRSSIDKSTSVQSESFTASSPFPKYRLPSRTCLGASPSRCAANSNPMPSFATYRVSFDRIHQDVSMLLPPVIKVMVLSVAMVFVAVASCALCYESQHRECFTYNPTITSHARSIFSSQCRAEYGIQGLFPLIPDSRPMPTEVQLWMSSDDPPTMRISSIYLTQ